LGCTTAGLGFEAVVFFFGSAAFGFWIGAFAFAAVVNFESVVLGFDIGGFGLEAVTFPFAPVLEVAGVVFALEAVALTLGSFVFGFWAAGFDFETVAVGFPVVVLGFEAVDLAFEFAGVGFGVWPNVANENRPRKKVIAKNLIKTKVKTCCLSENNITKLPFPLSRPILAI